MTRPDTNISDEQRQMARRLNLHPANVYEHLGIIDRLLSIQKHQGHPAMIVEISKIMGSI
jgi:hypothetical protein